MAHLSNYTLEELVIMTNQLQQNSISDGSLIRVAASDIYNIELNEVTVVHLIGMGSHFANEFAQRLVNNPSEFTEYIQNNKQ